MLQHVVFRNTRSKLTFIFGLNAYDSSNYINDVKSNVQSRKLTNAEAGLMLNFYTSYGAFFAKASYVKGLTLLDGLKDKPDIARSAPHAQFDMFKFFLLYNNKLRVVPLSFSSAFEGQYTNVEVYSQNQMTLSGSNGIRGFKDANVFGIRGISVKNDLDFRLFDVTQINYIKYLGFGVFLDGGITGSVNTGSNAGSASRKTNKIAGTGAKFTINHNNVDLNLTLAYPIYYSKHLAKEINKKPVVYIRGGLRI